MYIIYSLENSIRHEKTNLILSLASLDTFGKCPYFFVDTILVFIEVFAVLLDGPYFLQRYGLGHACCLLIFGGSKYEEKA